MTANAPLLHRRRLLQLAVAAAAVGHRAMAQAHGPAGMLDPPEIPPRVRMRGHDGRTAPIADLLRGRVTALQLMFTGCSATCPIQGALFADLERRLAEPAGRVADAQLISASIDPLGDDPKALAQWLGRFEAGRDWRAVSPVVADLDPWLDFLQGRQTGADRHTAQVYLFDRRGRLVLRTVDFPQPQVVVQMMQGVARQG